MLCYYDHWTAMEFCILYSSDCKSSSICCSFISSSDTDLFLLCLPLANVFLVFCSASARLFCMSSVLTMNFPFKTIHFPDSISFRLLSTLFSSTFSFLSIKLSTWRYSAIPLNLWPCLRVSVVTELSLKASLKTWFAVRNVITSGGELEIRYRVTLFSYWEGEGVTISEIVRRTRRGFSGNKPAPGHPPWIFDAVMPLTWGGIYLSTHSTLWSLEISAVKSLLSCAAIAAFNRPNTPTSTGWSMCDECGGSKNT